MSSRVKQITSQGFVGKNQQRCINEEVVKVQLIFSSNIDIKQVAQQIINTYVFILKIKIIKNNRLLVYFESMADVLEIDFEQKYSAKVRILHSNSFSKEIIKKQPSQKQEISQKSPLKSSVDFKQMQRKHKACDKLQKNQYDLLGSEIKYLRLTSVENEIIEDQNLQKQFNLFQDSVEYFDNFMGKEQKIELFNDFKDKQGESSTVQTQITKLNKEIQKDKTQNNWKPILEGAFVTGLLLGGIKLFKYFIK